MNIKFNIFINEQQEEVRPKYYIYTLSDPTDGEIKYVGKTKNMKERLWRHLGPSNLKNAWTSKTKWILWLKNQGLKPLIEILDEGDADNIDNLERYWISQIKQWGYKLKNDTSGGQGVDYWTGKKLSPEHIKKRIMNDPRVKNICEYEIGTDKLLAEYDSLADASRKNGHKPGTIALSCKGITIPGKHGVYWRYKDNYFPYVERDLKHRDETKLKLKIASLRKTVCQYRIDNNDLVKEYDSSRDAERETGINHAHINKCCKGMKNFNTAGGYYWRYKNDYFPLVKYDPKDNSKPVEIEQYDDKMNLIKVFKSFHEARKEGHGYRGIKNSSDKKTLFRNYYWKIKNKE